MKDTTKIQLCSLFEFAYALGFDMQASKSGEGVLNVWFSSRDSKKYSRVGFNTMVMLHNQPLAYWTISDKLRNLGIEDDAQDIYRKALDARLVEAVHAQRNKKLKGITVTSHIIKLAGNNLESK